MTTHILEEPIHVLEIAELCQKLSHGRAVAVLESTKKGRFCIYAMPSPEDFRLEEESFISLRSSSPMQTRRLCVLQQEGAKAAPLRLITSDIMHDVQQVIESRKAQRGHRGSPF